jgi:hypothetical protein
MSDQMPVVPVSFIGGALAGGAPWLLDRYVAASWPTWTAIIIAALIGWGLAAGNLATGNSKLKYSGTISFVVWAAICAAPFYMWQNDPVVAAAAFGVMWAIVTAIAGTIGNRQDTAWKKGMGMRTCPKCDILLNYAGEEYLGSTQNIYAGGAGTRTAQYGSTYKCPKCGYTTT